MIVAIHQPNYLPWLGFFAKLARADVFVFLDDVQFPKNGFTNRVQIAANDGPRWLTVPVSYRFGDPINRVVAADSDWRRSHLDMLKTHYSNAAAFKDVWTWLADIFERVPDANIAAGNQSLIEEIVERFGFPVRYLRASKVEVGNASGDDRLIAILRSIGSEVTYLSGKGGASYQDPDKFAAAGIELEYVNFSHPRYNQGKKEFLAGLSIVDALFHLGFERTAKLAAPEKVAT